MHVYAPWAVGNRKNAVVYVYTYHARRKWVDRCSQLFKKGSMEAKNYSGSFHPSRSAYLPIYQVRTGVESFPISR